MNNITLYMDLKKKTLLKDIERIEQPLWMIRLIGPDFQTTIQLEGTQ